MPKEISRYFSQLGRKARGQKKRRPREVCALGTKVRDAKRPYREMEVRGWRVRYRVGTARPVRLALQRKTQDPRPELERHGAKVLKKPTKS